MTCFGKWSCRVPLSAMKTAIAANSEAEVASIQFWSFERSRLAELYSCVAGSYCWSIRHKSPNLRVWTSTDSVYFSATWALELFPPNNLRVADKIERLKAFRFWMISCNFLDSFSFSLDTKNILTGKNKSHLKNTKFYMQFPYQKTQNQRQNFCNEIIFVVNLL